MATTVADIPKKQSNKSKPKSPKTLFKVNISSSLISKYSQKKLIVLKIFQSTKSMSRKPNLRPKLNNKLAPNYRLIPATPLSLPPLIQSLFFNPNQFQTPYISQYELKAPFPVQQQPPTRLPLLMQTSSTPLLTAESLELGPNDGQPVAVLHPNKVMLFYFLFLHILKVNKSFN
jgi:hypothetical protein